MRKTSAGIDELAKLRNIQDKVTEALELLFELLELYSPMWYEKRYHDQARAALQCARGQETTPIAAAKHDEIIPESRDQAVNE